MVEKKIIDKEIFYKDGIAVGDRTIIIEDPHRFLEDLLKEIQAAKKAVQ